MEWLSIVGFLFLGTLLIVAEIVLVPGITIVGILGIIFSICGIILSYHYYGITTGGITLALTFFLNLVVLILAFKNKSWSSFSLKESLTGRFNDDFKPRVKIGDRGITISSLKPMGKALVNDQEIEVRSTNDFINDNVEIEILKMDAFKIFVQSIKK